jgi:SAM-dependent methyltransferase
MMKPVFRRAALTIRQHRQKGKLLDVGTGFGFFLEEMRSLGWEVEGIEISRQGMDYARKAFNLNLYPGPLENARFRANEFDAVTAFYVIEHLPSPNRFLRECLRILKPGGLLLLRYPHTTPIKNLLHTLGIKNRLYDLPAHLSDFSPSAMQRCLTAAGFTRCRHWIGGVTVPGPLGKRLVTFLFGYSAEALFLLSGGRFLLPGVSKSVTAYKETPSPGVRKEQDG